MPSTFTADSLRDYLDSRRGCTFVTLYAVTVPKMLKTNNPYFGRLVHKWARNVTFGADYVAAIHRRWDEVGLADFFVPEKLWFGKGERINRYMARHTGTNVEYLVYQLRTDKDGKPLPHVFTEYRTTDTDEVVAKEDVEVYFPKISPSKKQLVEFSGCRETFPRTVQVIDERLGKHRLGVQMIKIDGSEFRVRA